MLLGTSFTTAFSDNEVRSVLYVDDDNIRGPWLGTLEYPFRYIQDAIDNASDDDTIRVYAGCYENPGNNVCVTKTLSIIGNGSVDTFIDRPVTITAYSVLFCGFRINGFDYETEEKSCCIHLKDSTSCVIKNNTIGLGLCGIELYNAHDNLINNNIFIEPEEAKPRIYLFLSNRNMIRQNQIYSGDFGIYVYNCQDNIIDNNNFTGGKNSINFHLSDNNTISNNTIKEQEGSINVISSNHNSFIENNISHNFKSLTFRDSCFNEIMRNKISNNICSISIDGSNNIISGNNILNNFYGGLNLGDYSSSNMISGNNISSNNGTGIGAHGSQNIIWGNIISHNDDGILHSDYHTNSNNYTITDNTIISNNGNGIKIYNSSYYLITNNIISKNENGIGLVGSSSITISGNIIRSNSNFGIYFYSLMWCYQGEPWNYHHFKNNQVVGNNITDNREYGIIMMAHFKYSYKSRNNKILENNFINNTQDAYIYNAFLNRWQRNYWNEIRLLPKFISGMIQREYNTKEFQWYNIDWRPALKPYNIGGV